MLDFFRSGRFVSVFDFFKSRKNTHQVLVNVFGIGTYAREASLHLSMHLADMDHALKYIIEAEHDGDKLVRAIHDDIDEHGFMMRPSPEDLTNLVTATDDVLDEIRKTAQHAVTFELQTELAAEESKQLVSILVDMVDNAVLLIAHVTGLRKITEPGEVVTHLNDLESKADEIRLNAEKRLFAEFNRPNANYVEYDSRRNLYRLLEHATDAANHCGVIALSIIRKEGY